MRPRGSVLVREVDVGLRDLRGQHEPVMLLSARLSQLLEALRPQHLAEGVRCIHGAVDHDVYDVDAFRREFRV